MTRLEAVGRSGALAMSLPALGALAMLFAEVNRGRTLGAELLEDPRPLVVFGPLFALCLFIAVRSWIPKPPGRIANATMAVFSFVVSIAMTGFFVMWCAKRGRRYDHEMAFWFSVPWPLLSGMAWGRGGALRGPGLEGWARWGHRVAAVGLVLGSLASIIVSEATRSTNPPALFFALGLIAYALPVSLFIIWPRKLPAEQAEPVEKTEPAAPTPAPGPALDPFDDPFDEPSA